MSDQAAQLEQELLGAPTPVMHQYLQHFSEGARAFLKGLASAIDVWDVYVSAGAKAERPAVTWSAAYFFNAINCALISTRLFLEGYVVASGNQARQAVESVAFGALLPFPATGAFRDWSAGREIEHTALERLVRNAENCGTKRKDIEALRQQAKWFDRYSHPSRLALASAWVPDSDTGFNLGALFVEGNLTQYKKEMVNRVSMTRLLHHTIFGTQRELVKRGLLTKGAS
jgi:hypothetical protein